jgi:hypothetical protein
MTNLAMNTDVVDSTWCFTTPAYWTTIEVNSAIMCACVMTLKPLNVKVFPGLVEVRLSSSEDLSMDWNNNPPTIGTKSTRTPQSTPQDTWVQGNLTSIEEDVSGIAGEAHQRRGIGNNQRGGG